MNTQQPSVVFIHGLWIHATSWQPWVDLFEKAGYQCHAPGWPGVRSTVAEARDFPEEIADKGIDDVVDHYLVLLQRPWTPSRSWSATRSAA